MLEMAVVRMVVALLVVASTPLASSAGVSPAEVCRSRAALEGRKYFSAVHKARQKCQDDVLRRKLGPGTDCAVEPRTALRIGQAGAKLEQKIVAQCTDSAVAAGTYADACAGVATVDGLVTCIRDSHLAAVVQLLPETGETDLSEDRDAQKCRKTVATQLRKVAERRMKEAQRCQGKQGSATNCIVEAESSAQLAKFEQRVASKVDALCGEGDAAPIARAEFPSPCGMEDSGRFYPCTRSHLSEVTNGLLQAEGVAADESLAGLEPITGARIPRTTAGVVLSEEKTVPFQGYTFEVDFYRNTSYSCGLSGNYTFMVINPAGSPNAEAPLWVWLHGGGQGYFGDDGVYVATNGLDENAWNHEETFDDLEGALQARVYDGNGGTEDQTLRRRLLEGYRMVVVSMCDHDWYSGAGTPYPNNPAGGEVNGLQATMAAIDYVAANYPTTHAWAHGTSAGSFGAWAVGRSFAQEGNPLTGIVADSGHLAPNAMPVVDAYLADGLLNHPSSFDIEETTRKIGVFADMETQAGPIPSITERDFRGVPSVFIHGAADPFCGGQLPPVAEAAAAGLTNCGYTFDGVVQAIAEQKDSPHEAWVLADTGHVPTNDPGPANDIVDDFIDGVLATNPPEFGAPILNTEKEPEETLGESFACPWDESDPTLHVFLAAGQSNMVSVYGQSGTLPTRYETGTDQLQMWDQGSWKRLGLSVENGNGVPRYGPELAFAWTVHAACPNSDIGFVKYAVGGTSIDTWVPTGENFAVLESNLAAAYLARPDITIEGFLYHQGGGDSRDRTKAESWGAKFVSLVDYARGAGPISSDLPFFVATPRAGDFPDDLTDFDPDSVPSPDPTRPFILHVVHQQWMVQFERPGIYPTINRDIPKGADGIHDTPDGIRAKGRNFAETFLSIQSASPAGAFVDGGGLVW